LKRIIIFSEKAKKKKTAIKTTMTKLKNIVPSIWGERWNWKQVKLLQNSQEKNYKPKKKDQIGKYNICKLGLNDEIENK
jgi:hypothetical protein